MQPRPSCNAGGCFACFTGAIATPDSSATARLLRARRGRGMRWCKILSPSTGHMSNCEHQQPSGCIPSVPHKHSEAAEPFHWRVDPQLSPHSSWSTRGSLIPLPPTAHHPIHASHHRYNPLVSLSCHTQATNHSPIHGRRARQTLAVLSTTSSAPWREAYLFPQLPKRAKRSHSFESLSL